MEKVVVWVKRNVYKQSVNEAIFSISAHCRLGTTHEKQLWLNMNLKRGERKKLCNEAVAKKVIAIDKTKLLNVRRSPTIPSSVECAYEMM